MAASCFAHAILAARGEWVTNEKTLLARARLSGVDGEIEAMTHDDISAAIARVRALSEAELGKFWNCSESDAL
ncbi:hypothetical protein ABIA39_000471 [Nocardia sp. GAS34]